MGNFNRDDRSGGDFRRGGRSSFGGGRGFDRGGDRGNRPLFDAICSNCGKACQVPFRPTNGKPVYCSDCFEKMGGRSDSRRPERSDFRSPAPSFDQNKGQFDNLNIKLDKILRLLEPKVEQVVAKTPVVPMPVEKVDMKEVVKKIKVVKAKKTTSSKKK